MLDHLPALATMPKKRKSVFNLKASTDEELAYFQEMVRKSGQTPSETMRQALARYGKELGLGDYPPPRARGRPPGSEAEPESPSKPPTEGQQT